MLQELTNHKGVTRLLNPVEVAEILGVSVATLAKWRCLQTYDLVYVKIGKLVMYRAEDVEQFILNNLKSVA